MALLYVVGTPIGNLGELSPRALEALRDCGLVLAEDTRVTRKLLSALQIPGKRLVSCFQHTRPRARRDRGPHGGGGPHRLPGHGRGHALHLGPRLPRGRGRLGRRNPRAAHLRPLGRGGRDLRQRVFRG